jgi:hypothetical protein
MTYIEQAAEAAMGSTVAVMISLGPDNQDVSMEPLDAPVDKADYIARKLRPVGTAALKGLRPVFAWSEHLPPNVIQSVGVAFMAYVGSLLGSGLVESLAAGEVAELERIYNYRDPNAPVN